MKNIVVVPFHDWRKITQEGSRTRDAHFINQFERNDKIENVIIINRPTTLLEILVKKQKYKIAGEVMLSSKGMKLIKVKGNVFVIDFISIDYIGLLRKKIKWIFTKFSDKDYIEFYKKSLDFLKINNPHFITHNVFAANFCIKANERKYLFDGYDNLVLFPKYNHIKLDIEALYSTLSGDSNCHWITNSATNKEYYQKYYQKLNVPVFPNGVDIDVLSKKYLIPEDLDKIPRPWIGFGGKITHLIDAKLFKYIVNRNPESNFVIVGKILDKDIYNEITNAKNVFYLGDKHYQDYLQYATNFDLAIIPYVTGDRDTGANTIKAYEFLAAGVPVIGTNGNGLNELEEYVYIAENEDEFTEYVREVKNAKTDKELEETYSWKYITEEVLTLF